MEDVLSTEANDNRLASNAHSSGLPKGPGAKRYAATAGMRNRSQHYKGA